LNLNESVFKKCELQCKSQCQTLFNL